MCTSSVAIGFWFEDLFVVFHSYGDVTITGEGLQMFTYTRYSWPWNSGGSLACHTCSDRGIALQWLSLRTRDTHTYCKAFNNGAVATCFYDWGLLRLGFKHPTFRFQDECSKPTAPLPRPFSASVAIVLFFFQISNLWYLICLQMVNSEEITFFFNIHCINNAF